MITETFDNKSKAIIDPPVNENALPVDACIFTFSHKIEKAVINKYDCRKTGVLHFAHGDITVYSFEYKGKTFAFYKTVVGAPACVGSVEDTFSVIRTKKYVAFGCAGCLDKEIAIGKIMIPTEAYRDEGTSYHYMPASDYITVKNSGTVEEFMVKNGLPYVKGRTWTTDSFYRETVNNFLRHKADGCISVEMECSALQAMCDFRNLELYMFFTGGDLLDAPEWDERRSLGSDEKGSQHDCGHFDIALELAVYIS